MKPALSRVALSCSAAALFFTLWILVPAPLSVLWLVSVISSEWSLYFGLLAFAGVLLGVIAAVKNRSWMTTLAIWSGLAALVFSAYPTFVSWPLKKTYNVPLSLKRYAFGSYDFATPEVKTFNYAQVDSQALQLDVYLPVASARTKRPAVVVVHGGSWKSGSRSDFPKWNTWLVSEGFIVFDIDYQLSPQPNWQTATEDVQKAVRWVKARADSFSVDPEKVVLMGRSAGGHLALLAAYTAAENEARLDPARNATVRAVVSFYAPTDLEWGYANPANQRVIDGRATLRLFTGGTPNYIPEIYRKASPIHHVHNNMPATLLIHGLKDQLVRNEQTQLLLDALEKTENTDSLHQALFIPYAQHGFDYNFNGWGSQVTQVVLLRHLNIHLQLH